MTLMAISSLRFLSTHAVIGLILLPFACVGVFHEQNVSSSNSSAGSGSTGGINETTNGTTSNLNASSSTGDLTSRDPDAGPCSGFAVKQATGFCGAGEEAKLCKGNAVGACVACSPGRYKNLPGRDSCYSCPPQSTSGEGATASSACYCTPGFYPERRFTSKSVCTVCPIGAQCPGLENLQEPIAAPGYFLMGPMDFAKCPWPHACLGGNLCAEGYEGNLCNKCSHGYDELDDPPGCSACHENGCGDDVRFVLAIVIAILVMIVLCTGYFVAYRRGWLCFKRPEVLLPPKPQPTGLVPDPEAVFLNPPAPPPKPKGGKKGEAQSIGKSTPPPPPTQVKAPRFPPPAPPPAESRSIPASRGPSQAGQYSMAGSRPGTSASSLTQVTTRGPIGIPAGVPPGTAQSNRPPSAMSNASVSSVGSKASSVSSATSNSSVILQMGQAGVQMPPMIYKKPKTKASVRRAEREAQRQAVRQELGIGAADLDDGASDSGAEGAVPTSAPKALMPP